MTYKRQTGFLMVDRPAVAAPDHVVDPAPDGPCRWCREDAYAVDEVGPVHLCCERVQSPRCAACVASRKIGRRK